MIVLFRFSIIYLYLFITLVVNYAHESFAIALTVLWLMQ